MSCFWRHQWGPWSDLSTRDMMFDMAGTDGLVHGIEHFQRRTCSLCNEVQEKIV